MNDTADRTTRGTTLAEPTLKERLRAAAERALHEAEQRREAGRGAPLPAPEIDGPKGPEPVRYGDWDVKGRASDF